MLRPLAGLLVAFLAALVPLAPARAETEVDLALVIAVDISYSMDMEELALQREGFAEAFRSPAVQDAIRRGVLGRIAVAYFEWAGAADQRIVVPWTLIDGANTAGAFAERVAAVPVRRAQRTSISAALDFGVRALAESGFSAGRQVIDVSGDGPNNQGRMVTAARDDAVAAGITVNGLPLMLKQPGYFDIPDLDLYYKGCVIGGPGAFVVPVRERGQLREAIKTKILLEVAGGVPDAPLVQPAQAEARPNCLVGEAQWRDRMGN